MSRITKAELLEKNKELEREVEEWKSASRVKREAFTELLKKFVSPGQVDSPDRIGANHVIAEATYDWPTIFFAIGKVSSIANLFTGQMEKADRVKELEAENQRLNEEMEFAPCRRPVRR